MKTYNLNLELITPMQINKDTLINEALLRLDSLSNLSVSDFIEEIPGNADIGKKYILNSGDKANCIIYCAEAFQMLANN